MIRLPRNDARMIGRMMARMSKQKPASSCPPRMIGPKAGWYHAAFGHHPGLRDRPDHLGTHPEGPRPLRRLQEVLDSRDDATLKF